MPAPNKNLQFSLAKKFGQHFQKTLTLDMFKEFESSVGKRLGQGSSRIVFDLNNGKVAKIPHYEDWQGNLDAYSAKTNGACNITEYLIFKLRKDLPILPCEFYFFKAIPIIVMEKVDLEGKSKVKYEDFPDKWNCFSDGFQAGLTKENKLLAYDYGYENRRLTEKYKNCDITFEEYEMFMEGRPVFPQEYLKPQLVVAP